MSNIFKDMSTETIKDGTNDIVLKRFSKIIKRNIHNNVGGAYTVELLDGTILTVTKTFQGYNLDVSNEDLYIDNDNKNTLMSFDRLIYCLSMLTSKINLLLKHNIVIAP